MFYVTEEGNDFTFLLDAAENLKDLNEFFSELSGAGEAKRKGSFADEIAFRNLLGEAEVENIEEDFWTRGNEQTKALDYLCERISESDADIVERFKANQLSADDKKSFKDLLNTALKDSRFKDLAEQAWIDPNEFQRDSLLSAVSSSHSEYPEAYRHLLLEFYFPQFHWKSHGGRALICRSHAGEYLSVTVRKQERKADYGAKHYQDWGKRAEYLFSPGEYCDQVYEAMFSNGKPIQGLLVVTGSTNSLKSEIARGVIHLYLQNKSRGARERPHHLVTFEDPIERFYYDDRKKGLRSVALPKEKDRIDYTPRQGDRDATTLKRALQDALRQTPTVFYVGETRNRRDWRVLLDFAATGHLIVTTAHAGSLVEAMHKIFEACNVQTPGDRAEIARKLFGLIHLRSHQIPHGVIKKPGDPTSAAVLLPAVWKHTDSGIAALISNGLASVLPDQNEKASCLGRRWFIDRLIERGGSGGEADIKKFFNEAEKTHDGKDIRSALLRIAREWDLEGV
jgi:hypothetical protein